MEKKGRVNALLSLIEALPEKENWLFKEGDEWEVTNEWLCGTFAGRSFPGKTKEEAVEKLIEYLDRHIGHDSIVGTEVDKSGWPDLDAVKRYLDERKQEV